MIDSTALNTYPGRPTDGGNISPPARFHMKRDPDARMAGSIPVWEGKTKTVEPAFEAALSYAATTPAAGESTDSDTESFGFGDLVDIVNPLHHIPLVSQLYEGLTGDTIKPSGRILGGALFGGFAGAAAGIANVIIEEETGKDMAGNMVALIADGHLPNQRKESLSPEEHLNQAARLAFSDVEVEILPPLALALQPQPQALTKEAPADTAPHFHVDEARMAGTTPRRDQLPAARTMKASPSPLPPANLADPVSINLALIRADQARMPLTDLKLSAMPQE